MLVIPAVDLMQGKCVRLVTGDPNKMKVYFDNPTEAANRWADQGAHLIHLVDLDAAIGTGQNIEAIGKIIGKVSVKTQVGGGIRTLEKAEKLVRLGASRVIFGTACISNSALLAEAVERFGSERVAAAVDTTRKGEVTFHGWTAKSEVDYLELVRSVELMGTGTIIFTAVSVDGTLKGPPVDQIRRIVGAVKIPVVASGGIGSLEDLVHVARTGVKGAIVGTALYEEKFTLEQAMEAVKNVG
ncbi:MAG: 1-(5-phosphoribosyl)-5-[(5-phosphoribosylamino)methylideneamino]imidazole-4-carboxamide isomerase [Candidatus Bathyarchaeota archaeon]|nr:MAG: 1-(5-phosphoribosyl)-5-[(5-phosphoribosylamino)methylideneamino]imidazole-4-carboxamide isomerase [Candidatus Bathyarchaeota archaeon]